MPTLTQNSLSQQKAPQNKRHRTRQSHPKTLHQSHQLHPNLPLTSPPQSLQQLHPISHKQVKGKQLLPSNRPQENPIDFKHKTRIGSPRFQNMSHPQIRSQAQRDHIPKATRNHNACDWIIHAASPLPLTPSPPISYHSSITFNHLAAPPKELAAHHQTHMHSQAPP